MFGIEGVWGAARDVIKQPWQSVKAPTIGRPRQRCLHFPQKKLLIPSRQSAEAGCELFRAGFAHAGDRAQGVGVGFGHSLEGPKAFKQTAGQLRPDAGQTGELPGQGGFGPSLAVPAQAEVVHGVADALQKKQFRAAGPQGHRVASAGQEQAVLDVPGPAVGPAFLVAGLGQTGQERRGTRGGFMGSGVCCPVGEDRGSELARGRRKGVRECRFGRRAEKGRGSGLGIRIPAA